MATKKKGGLDALFSKVFDKDDVKDAIASLHTDYSAPAAPPPPSVKESVDHVISVDTGGAGDKADNRADRQTSKQPSKRSSNASDKQTVEQSNIDSNNQATEQSSKQAREQSLEHANNHISNQPDNLSGNQALGQTVEQYNRQYEEQSIKQPIRQYISQQAGKHIWMPLNENQGRILLFLYEKGGGLTNMEIVVEETSIAYGTARACIDVLIREGYVTYKARHNGHSFRGFEYAMNNHLCSLYAARVRGEHTEQTPGQSIKQTFGQANNQATRQGSGQSGSQAMTVVSSYLSESKTTTAEDPTIVEILKDPELGYWRDKGVNGRQLKSWSDEFQMPIDQLAQSLKYCRYDMVILNLEEEKQISNPMNWFYKVMQRSGLYPKPNGYRSLAEIRVEQMEQAAKEAADIRHRQLVVERELAFQKVMADPDGAEYQTLLAKIDNFAREMGGKAFEVAMREAFGIS